MIVERSDLIAEHERGLVKAKRILSWDQVEYIRALYWQGLRPARLSRVFDVPRRRVVELVSFARRVNQ